MQASMRVARLMCATVRVALVGGYSVLVSANRTGNQRPVTPAIHFFENRSIFNLFRTFQLMLVINTITCKYVVISYSCIISA